MKILRKCLCQLFYIKLKNGGVEELNYQLKFGKKIRLEI
jgi:hypothetical protein